MSLDDTVRVAQRYRMMQILTPLPLREILPRHYGHRRKRFAG